MNVRMISKGIYFSTCLYRQISTIPNMQSMCVAISDYILSIITLVLSRPFVSQLIVSTIAIHSERKGKNCKYVLG